MPLGRFSKGTRDAFEQGLPEECEPLLGRATRRRRKVFPGRKRETVKRCLQGRRMGVTR